jgi:peptidoglycan/LPS O-acetylase OafA/YrhL
MVRLLEMRQGQRLGYLPALDGVRGIAIALVVSFHAFGWPRSGTLGVDLFFVLSGFLITTLLLEEHRRSGRIRIRAFYARRAWRLLPALIALLVPFLLLAGAALLIRGAVPSSLLLGIGAALTYTSNLVVASDISAVPAALVHLWSLAAEGQFYVVWPLVVLVVLRRGGFRLLGRALVVLLAIAVAYRLQLLLRGASIERVAYGPDTHADSLLVGCIFGCYFVRGRLPGLIASERARKVSITLSLVAVLGAAALVGQVPSRLAYETRLVPTLFALAAGVFVVCAALGGSAVARALSARPLAFLGGVSYSVYLWHLPLLVAFAGVDRHFGLRTVAAVFLSVLVATGSRYLIELPCIARARSRRPEPVRQAVPVAATA